VRAGGGGGTASHHTDEDEDNRDGAAHLTDEDENQEGADGLYGSSGRRASVRSQRRRNEHSNEHSSLKHAADAYAAGDEISADEVCTVELLSEEDDDDDDGGVGEGDGGDGGHGFNAGTHSVLAQASRDSPARLHESHVRAAPRVPGGPLPDLAAMMSSDEEEGVDDDYEAAVQAAEHRRQLAREQASSRAASHRASGFESEERSPNGPIAPRAAGPPYIDDAYDRGEYDDDDGGERQAPHQLLDGDGDHRGGYDEYGYGDEGRRDARPDGGVMVRAEEARDRHDSHSHSRSLRADENFVDDDWDDDGDR